MMARFRKPLAVILAALLAFTLISCILGGDKVAGRGSEVENELGVYGVLVDEGGKPVAGAAVTVKPMASGIGKVSAARVRLSDSESVLTDARGRYAFEKLGEGDYDIFGNFRSGVLVVLIPRVTIQSASKGLDIGTDTLRAPGSIHGRLLRGTDGQGDALCYIPGTSYLATSDDSGLFAITGVPQGRYSVRYSIEGLAPEQDTGVVVRAGLATDLPERRLSLDTAGAPPPPQSLRVEYDTLAATARLRWNSVPVADLSGYEVYRDNGAGDAPQPINARIVKDTAYTDSLWNYVQSGQTRTFLYRVKAVDRGANASAIFSEGVSVLAVPPSIITTQINLFARPGSVVSFGDTVSIIAEFGNPRNPILKVEWYLDAQAVPARSADLVSLYGHTFLSGTDTFRFAFADSGGHDVRCVVTDASGRSWVNFQHVEVIRDAPLVESYIAALVSIGDSVELSGDDFAKEEFGRITKWEWDIGAKGTFIEVPGGRISFQAPMAPDSAYPCVLRVTDDDGQQGQGVVSVRVLLDAPMAVIKPIAMAVFAGDSLSLTGAGSRDSLGKIVKWEWDIGERGTFITTPGPEIRFQTPATPQEIACALRVTDDDGLTQTAKTMVPVSIRNRWIRVSQSAPEASRLGVGGNFTFGTASGKAAMLSHDGSNPSGPWAFMSSSDMLRWDSVQAQWLPEEKSLASRILEQGGKMWVFCYDGSTKRNELWSSRDGTAWARTAQPAFMAGRQGYVSLVRDERFWVFADSAGGPVQAWTSADAVSWTRMSDSLGFRPRSEPVVHAGRIWFLGGKEFDQRMDEPYQLWSSVGGSAWSRVTDSLPIAAKNSVTLLTSGGRLWALGGENAGTAALDVWSSVDGIGWSRMIPMPGDLGFLGMYCMVFNGRIWNVGAPHDGNVEIDRLGDVWLAPYP